MAKPNLKRQNQRLKNQVKKLESKLTEAKTLAFQLERKVNDLVVAHNALTERMNRANVNYGKVTTDLTNTRKLLNKDHIVGVLMALVSAVRSA